jgi:L-ribulose-5-phosphate 3-epimerase
MNTSRRNFIKNTSTFVGSSVLLPKTSTWSAIFKKQRFKIGACDWSMGTVCDLKAFDLAKQIGLTGFQLSLGQEKDDFKLRQKSIQDEFLAKSRQTGIKISSLGIADLNNFPYKSEPRAEQWVSDSIDVAKNMGVSVVLLAFFSKNDLRNDDLGKKEVIYRLRKVAPKAEKAGITLGIESYLTAEEHLEIMEAVGSKAVKVYYDFRNATDAGNDIYKEIKQLGKKNICELHIKENGFLLDKGSIDWAHVGEALHEINYKGDSWMQIEWAKPENMDIIEAYQHNLAFLKGIFRT